MNIKNLTSPISSLDSVNRTAPNKEVRTESSTDRDADGRRQRSEDQREEKRHLNDEEKLKIIEYLKNIPGVQMHNLQVRVQAQQDTCVFIIETLKGERIRRLSVNEAWHLVSEQDQSKGNLLNKAM